jgi:hypothetical protein
MKLPERDQLIAAVRGMRDDCCMTCDCKDRPNFHEVSCVGTVPVRLRIDSEDWNLLRSTDEDEFEDDVLVGESTIGFDDSDTVIEHVVDQLLSEVISAAEDEDLLEAEEELVGWG